MNENRKVYFSPYMLKIIEHTREYREGFINMKVYVELVSSVSDTYENYVNEVKKNG
tara:strand:- start:907 stop:1074 length:168 start_codon:yes stop_codon:yes gene_type:complete